MNNFSLLLTGAALGLGVMAWAIIRGWRTNRPQYMRSPEWKTKQRAFQAEQRGRGIG